MCPLLRVNREVLDYSEERSQLKRIVKYSFALIMPVPELRYREDKSPYYSQTSNK